MPRSSSQEATPPKERLRCLSCGSMHLFPIEVDTAEGRVRQLRCLDCGWHGHEPRPEPSDEPPLRAWTLAPA